MRLLFLISVTSHKYNLQRKKYLDKLVLKYFIQTRQEIAQLGYNVGFKEKNSELEGTNQENTVFSLATKIYQHNLFSGAGKSKLAYLQQKRQLNCVTIEQFELGCAVDYQQLTNL